MKLKTFLFAFVLLIQNVALAMPGNSLKAVYDDYLYSLTVEWDQVDQERLAEIQDKFEAELAALEKQGGLSKDAIKDLVEGEVHEGKIPEEILNDLSTSSGAIDLEKLQVVMKNHEAGLYNRGANWNGAAFLAYTAYAFLPALLIIGIITSSGRKDMCTLPGTGYGYGEPFQCNPNPTLN